MRLLNVLLCAFIFFGALPVSAQDGGALVFTLSWEASAQADLDFSVFDPNGNELYFDNKSTPEGGWFNDDAGNNFCENMSANPREIAAWSDSAPEGWYELTAYTNMGCADNESAEIPFTLTVEVNGEVIDVFEGVAPSEIDEENVWYDEFYYEVSGDSTGGDSTGGGTGGESGGEAEQPAIVHDGTPPYFIESDCPFDVPAGHTVDCGWLVVQEDRAGGGQEVIDLAVATIRTPNAKPDPVIYLEGGPGGSAIAGIGYWLNNNPFPDRDLILIDQRGTGYSYPSLNCTEFDEDPESQELDPDIACYERLTDMNINLSAYNTAENAADIADLRRALGYEQVNLYGVSYGTRLALTVIRDHPEGIRSVIIDAVYPPHVNAYEEQAVNGAKAMLHLFDLCAADAECAAAYGDIGAKFLAMVDAYNEEPLLYYDEEYDEEVEIYGDDMVLAIFDALYDSDVIPALPYGIALLDEGEDTDFAFDVLSGYYRGSDLEAMDAGGDPWANADEEFFPDIDDDSEGMFNAVDCFEEFHFNDLANSEALAADIPPQLNVNTDAEEMGYTCDIWQVGRSGAVENEPVRSDVPVLVLSGTLDPITPPIWGAKTAEHLSHAYHFVFKGLGHGAIGSHPCADQIARAFLADPASAPDSACVGGVAPKFYIP